MTIFSYTITIFLYTILIIITLTLYKLSRAKKTMTKLVCVLIVILLIFFIFIITSVKFGATVIPIIYAGALGVLLLLVIMFCGNIDTTPSNEITNRSNNIPGIFYLFTLLFTIGIHYNSINNTRITEFMNTKVYYSYSEWMTQLYTTNLVSFSIMVLCLLLAIFVSLAIIGRRRKTTHSLP